MKTTHLTKPQIVGYTADQAMSCACHGTAYTIPCDNSPRSAKYTKSCCVRSRGAQCFITPTGAVAYQIPCPAQMTKPPCRCRQCIAYYKPQFLPSCPQWRTYRCVTTSSLKRRCTQSSIRPKRRSSKVQHPSFSDISRRRSLSGHRQLSSTPPPTRTPTPIPSRPITPPWRAPTPPPMPIPPPPPMPPAPPLRKLRIRGKLKIKKRTICRCANQTSGSAPASFYAKLRTLPQDEFCANSRGSFYNAYNTSATKFSQLTACASLHAKKICKAPPCNSVWTNRGVALGRPVSPCCEPCKCFSSSQSSCCKSSPCSGDIKVQDNKKEAVQTFVKTITTHVKTSRVTLVNPCDMCDC
ncbi:uncharacterized protein LOC113363769 [Ctenocephalides felis]|uniref:uncharacterized protein LOC113363769 n=1 Tax=Ctenocephalides felis TaxID=7515 RepID=UPI000E6E1607|nr:uncharacterized protein LOC113363769 [Ctenocephalides felis]